MSKKKKLINEKVTLWISEHKNGLLVCGLYMSWWCGFGIGFRLLPSIRFQKFMRPVGVMPWVEATVEKFSDTIKKYLDIK